MAAYNNNDFENQEFMKIKEPKIINKKYNKKKKKKNENFGEQFNELLFSDKKTEKLELNDYTNFNDNSMDYGIQNGKFTHSNMVPFSNRKDDSYFEKGIGTRILQSHTGRDKHWKHKKETENFFDPQKDFKNINGFESYTQKIKNRFIPSIYTDARLPNTNMRVGPGLRQLDIVKNYNVQPSDNPEENFTQPEDKLSAIKNAQDGLSTNFRILPKTIDQLRPEGMQKISYRGVVNHGKSEVNESTSRDFNVTKWKMKNFKETTDDDFIPKLAKVPKQAMYGSIKRSTNARHHPDVKIETTYGPLMNPKGIIIGTEDFTHTQTSKSSFNNDKHLITDPQNKKGHLQTYNRPATTLKETVLYESYGNVQNENSTYLNNFEQPQTTLKETVLHESYGNVQNENSTYINTKEQPQTTLKETILHENYGPSEQKFTSYVNAKEAPRTTLKETILRENYGPSEQKFTSYVNAKEAPQTTLKETILHENYGPVKQQFTSYVNAKETPGTTLKETLLHENYGPVKQQFTSYVNAKETPGTTMKETALYENYGNVGNMNMNTNYINTKEIPGTTMRETVLHESYGNVGNMNMNTNYINTKEIPGTTMKETALYESYGNVTDANKNMQLNNYQAPQSTLKETVLYESYGNVTDANKNMQLNNYQAPQTTLKETVLYESYGNVTDAHKNVQLNNYQAPQTTLKETMLHESYGNIGNENSIYVNNYEPPDITTKESTLYTYQGQAKTATNKSLSRISAKNMRLSNKKHNKPTYRKPQKIKKTAYSGTMVSGRVTGKVKENTYQYHNITADSKTEFIKTTQTRSRRTRNLKNKLKSRNISIPNITKNPYINNLVHQSESAMTESIKLR